MTANKDIHNTPRKELPDIPTCMVGQRVAFIHYGNNMTVRFYINQVIFVFAPTLSYYICGHKSIKNLMKGGNDHVQNDCYQK